MSTIRSIRAIRSVPNLRSVATGNLGAVPPVPPVPFFTTTPAAAAASSSRSLASVAHHQHQHQHQPQIPHFQSNLTPTPSKSALRIRRADANDYASISALINANRGLDLTPKERSEKGFVQGSWEPNMLEQLSSTGPGFWIAEITGGEVPASQSATGSGWRLAGAALATAPGAVVNGPAGETNYLAEKHFGPRGYYLYGPVVVDSQFRGHGVLRKLSDAVFAGTRDTYATAVAFIEEINHVSRVVHERLGWKAVDGFQVNGSKYNVFSHPTA